MRLEPLGDAAVLATCADEKAAADLAASWRAHRPGWLVDVTLAYRSVAAHYDLNLVGLEAATNWLKSAAAWPSAAEVQDSRLHLIPCSYGLGPDLEAAATALRLSPDDLIRRHAAQAYRIFAIGFSPGFPYLGYLPEPLCGLTRLASPRKRVEPGSVAIVGNQCCVYPSPTPGGWRLIGRTPRKVVDLEAEHFPLRAGDFVQFIPISESAFRHQLGELLDPPVPAETKRLRQSVP